VRDSVKLGAGTGRDSRLSFDEVHGITLMPDADAPTAASTLSRLMDTTPVKGPRDTSKMKEEIKSSVDKMMEAGQITVAQGPEAYVEPVFYGGSVEPPSDLPADETAELPADAARELSADTVADLATANGSGSDRASDLHEVSDDEIDHKTYSTVRDLDLLGRKPAQVERVGQEGSGEDGTLAVLEEERQFKADDSIDEVTLNEVFEPQSPLSEKERTPLSPSSSKGSPPQPATSDYVPPYQPRKSAVTFAPPQDPASPATPNNPELAVSVFASLGQATPALPYLVPRRVELHLAWAEPHTWTWVPGRRWIPEWNMHVVLGAPGGTAAHSGSRGLLGWSRGVVREVVGTLPVVWRLKNWV